MKLESINIEQGTFEEGVEELRKMIDEQIVNLIHVSASGWKEFKNNDHAEYSKLMIKQNEMIEWATKEFGPSCELKDWRTGRWLSHLTSFWFRDVEDLTWFKLRWS